MITDQDGVADYLDLEKYSFWCNGWFCRAIDLNNNNVPDELESYLTANYVNKSDKTTLNDNELKA
jgi:OOP family OmpA-OmpF porin